MILLNVIIINLLEILADSSKMETLSMHLKMRYEIVVRWRCYSLIMPKPRLAVELKISFVITASRIGRANLTA